MIRRLNRDLYRQARSQRADREKIRAAKDESRRHNQLMFVVVGVRAHESNLEETRAGLGIAGAAAPMFKLAPAENVFCDDSNEANPS